MRRLKPDAAPLRDHALSSVGVMWRAGPILCVVFLLAMALQLAAKKACSSDIIGMVQEDTEASNATDLDSRLYTPTTDDYMRCPKSTMSCFSKEAMVLEQEWEGIPNKLYRNLDYFSRRLQKSNLDCPQCELYTERGTREFLEGLLSVLKAMNSANCPSVGLGSDGSSRD